MKSSTKNIIIAAVCLILGYTVAFFIYSQKVINQISTAGEQEKRGPDSGMGFTNPLLDCAEMSDLTDKKVLQIKDKVESYVSDQKSAYKINEVAVYFRDLNNGPWFGINEKESFFPASLLKVPIMLATYHQAMENSEFLKGKVVVPRVNYNDAEFYKSSKQLVTGETVSFGELVESMIKYSDNNATNLLVNALDRKSLTDAYVDLGIKVPDDPSYTISVKTYASFFRILFNSTYLSKEFSERALQILSQSDFKHGLRSGIPEDVVVAHKFGERDIGDGVKQLHDCGIVYVPGKPYLVCLMTRGSDFNKLDKVITEVSKIIYDGVVAE